MANNSKSSLVKQVLLGLSTTLALSLVTGVSPARAEEGIVSDPVAASATDIATTTSVTSDTTSTEATNDQATDTTVDTDQVADDTVEAAAAEEAAETEESKPAIDETNMATGEAKPEPNVDAASTEEAIRQIDHQTAEDPIENREDTVYMTEKTIITEKAEVGDIDPTTIQWTLNGKPLNESKTYVMKDGTFTGDQFINIDNASVVNGQLNFNITINSLFGRDLSLRTPNNIRRTFLDYMHEYVLEGKTADGKVIRKVINLRPYEKYMTYDEMLKDIQDTTENHKEGRLVETEIYGKTAQGRDMHYGIVAKDQASIDNYLNVLTPAMLKHPDQVKALLESGKLDYKVPVLINNTHADEQPGTDIVRDLFKQIATKDVIHFNMTQDGVIKKVSLNVSELLDKFIFLFNFSENPDGSVANTRELANDLDPNRDASYQANPETVAISGLINKWNPMALYDLHGFVRDFLIEPTTPPHDPNFEYDLVSETMMEHAREMGNAGTTNTNYNHYIIPKVYYGDGWDDAFSGYTGVYAVYHGILGHTIEIPETNHESFKAGSYAVLGGINYIKDNLDRLMANRLTFYSRGVNKVEDPRAEEELVGPDGKTIGRIKGDNPKFFPDYYVIPMTPNGVRDTQAAFDMIEYFKRNGVEVKELKADMGPYKKGDLVIDMAQAKRGYANHILYKGSNESAWAAMYAELVVNFPDMRGFDADPIFADGKFDGFLGQVTHTKAPRSQVGTAPYYKVANNSATTVKAINAAIKAGAKVYKTKDGYIVDRKTLAHLLDNYALYAQPIVDAYPSGQTLKPLKVFVPKKYEAWQGRETILDSQIVAGDLGFQVVDSIDDADVLILQSGQFDPSLLGKKPTMILGGDAMARLEELGLLKGFDAEMFKDGWSHEGLLKALIDKNTNLSSGYSLKDLFYSNSGSWIEGIPAGFKKIVEVAGDDFFISGWWPGYDGLSGKVMAIDGTYNNQPLFIYAGNPTNRRHTKNLFGWLANAIFRDTADAQLIAYTPNVPGDDDKDKDKDHDKPSDPSVVPGDNNKDQADDSSEKPNQDGAKEDTQVVEVIADQASQTSAALLPATGEDMNENILIAGFALVLGSSLVYFSRKQEN